MKPFFISVPHSGEQIPAEAQWLQNLPETLLMCDVDRFVDKLYVPVIEKLSLPHVFAQWHRYVVDLNRIPEDIDQQSVEGAVEPPGTHPIGLHWSVTTKGDVLLPQPISKGLHEQLVKDYFDPFHAQVRAQYKKFFDSGAEKVYQLDAHSMPSVGTEKHRDPGETRAEIVVSDYNGKSCDPAYTELVVESYRQVGFEVAINWPYVGGRVTQTYGHPDQGQHAIQVELRRSLYMDEESKQLLDKKAKEVSEKIQLAVSAIYKSLSEIP